MEMSIAVPIEDASRIGEARREAFGLARTLGFSEEDATRVSIVATELATNLHRHALRDRWLLARQLLYEVVPGIELLSLDGGPGIPNVAQASRDGFSTAGSQGQGLGAIRRMADSVDVQSTASGTAVVARLYAGRCPGDPQPIGAVVVPYAGQLRSGDAWALVRADEVASILVADGLGHGPDAADASAAAVVAFRADPLRPPAAQVAVLHEALRNTRGAAIAVARLDPRQRRIAYAGLGNISGVVVRTDGTQNLVSMHGTAGKHSGRVTEFSYDWPQGAVLVMHTDGLSTRWDLQQHPGLLLRHPSLIAGVLFRDFARGRDDACVVAYRAVDPA